MERRLRIRPLARRWAALRMKPRGIGSKFKWRYIEQVRGKECEMKYLRKLIAAALTMVMALAISTVAYASDYVITVKNDNANISINGKTYTAYKLFDAVYSEGTSASYTIKKDNYFYTDTTASRVG